MALCAISGEVPREPVVSTKSGHVFEKRLIEQHLATTGTCPVTNQELSTANLIPLQTSKVVKPRPPSATSIPGIIQIMQNEWDSLMLESYTLKKHLDDVRQELAHALYQHDAACRVIARLIKERDAARAALGDTQANMAAAVASAPAAGAGAVGAGAGAAAMSDDAAPGITKAISAKMEATEKALSAQRKKTVKAAQARVPAKEKIAAFTQISSNTPHSASKPGVTALDVYGSELALSGGADGNAVLLNVQTGKILDTLKAHKKKVTAVKFGRNGPETAFTASEDGTAIVWKGDGVKFSAAFTAADHKAAVNAVTVHPSGDFFITASADGAWNFYDATAGSLRASVADEKVAAAGGYTRAAFHPDGLILGTGAADAVVRIFDVRARTVGATVKGHAGPITDLVFSENGFYLASADAKAVVKLWDLRKLDNLCTLSPADVLKGVKAVHALDFDASGTYLAAATDKDVRVFATSKTWDFVHTFADHSDAVTAVRWGADANTLFTASLDRSLRVFGSK